MFARALVPFLFIVSLIQVSFSSSFDELEEVVARTLSLQTHQIGGIISNIYKSHEELGQRQYVLYQSLLQLEQEANKDPPSSTPPLASSSSSASLKSSKKASSVSSIPTSKGGANDNWEGVNFVLGNLVMVTANGEVISFEIPHSGSTGIYDSCFDRSRNQIPTLPLCMEQWRRYLGEKALIFNDGTQKVKYAIEKEKSSLEETIKRFAHDTQKENLKDAFKGLEGAKDSIRDYHHYITTWVRVGWHSEQRLIFDLDAEPTKTQLKSFIGGKDIKLIVGCVHSRLAPCIAKKPDDDSAKLKGKGPETRTCDCFNCLKNWPEQWSFLSEISGISVFMTVSYLDYPNSNPEEDYTAQPVKNGKNFFVSRMPTSSKVSLNLKVAEDWIRKVRLNRQISFFRNNPSLLLSPLELDLVDALLPLMDDRMVVSYQESLDLFECRSFSIQFPDQKLQRKYLESKNNYELLHSFMGDFCAATSDRIDLKLYTADAASEESNVQLSLYASPITKESDTDWGLLIKMLGLFYIKKNAGRDGAEIANKKLVGKLEAARRETQHFQTK